LEVPGPRRDRTDTHHFQVGVGLGVAISRRIGVFAEGIPLGERAISLGFAGRVLERAPAGQRLAEHERVDLVRALVGVHALEIEHVPDRWILEQNAVAPSKARERRAQSSATAHVVALAQGDLLRQKLALLVLQAAKMVGEQIAFDEFRKPCARAPLARVAYPKMGTPNWMRSPV